MDAELFEYVFYMTVYGPDADVQGAGDFLVHVTFAQETEDFEFTRSQLPHFVECITGWEGGEHALKIFPNADGNLSGDALSEAGGDERVALALAEMFAWQIERDGEILVGYRSRLEASRQLQHSIAFVGWPLLGVGVLLVVLACRLAASGWTT